MSAIVLAARMPDAQIKSYCKQKMKKKIKKLKFQIHISQSERIIKKISIRIELNRNKVSKYFCQVCMVFGLFSILEMNKVGSPGTVFTTLIYFIRI